MFTFETLLVVGLFIVVGSMIALTVTQYTRHWFFQDKSRAALQPVRAHRDPFYESHK